MSILLSLYLQCVPYPHGGYEVDVLFIKKINLSQIIIMTSSFLIEVTFESLCTDDLQ